MKDWDEGAPLAPKPDLIPAAPRRARRPWLVSAGLVGSGLIAGGILAGSQIAGAQSPSATTPPAVTAPRVDPATIDHGPNETLLTGTAADKVKAAALKAVPGGTIIRVETDSNGSPYEAHMRKADGSFVTVKIDNAFNVTSTDTGFGGHGPRSGG